MITRQSHPMIPRRALNTRVLSLAVVLMASLSAAAEPVWSRVGLPSGAGRVQAIAVDDLGRVYAGTDTDGVFRSDNNGATWVRAGLGNANIYALATKPGGPGTAYAGTLDGLYRTSNSGQTWSLVVPGRSVLSLAINLLMPTTVYVGTSTGVLKSTDDGASFASASTGPSIGISSLAVDPSAPGKVYAGTIAFNVPNLPTGAGVFATADGGSSWIPVPGVGTLPVFALAIDVGPPKSIYAAAGAVEAGVYRSADDGTSWVKAALDGPTYALAVDRDRAGVVYAGGNGVFRSADGGMTWARAVNGLSGPGGSPALILSLATASNGLVYAGTGLGDGGVYRAKFLQTGSCRGDATTLCVQDGRFGVTVNWSDTRLGSGGSGHALPITLDTGAFWFFSANNLELVIKVVDGRVFNERFWVFAGSLTDVAYTISVSDTLSGVTRTYTNTQGTLSSFADTNAFVP